MAPDRLECKNGHCDNQMPLQKQAPASADEQGLHSPDEKVHTPTKEEDATKGGDAQEADQDNKQAKSLGEEMCKRKLDKGYLAITCDEAEDLQWTLRAANMLLSSEQRNDIWALARALQMGNNNKRVKLLLREGLVD